MILYQVKINIKNHSDWPDAELDAVIEEISDELENLKDLIEQKLSQVHRFDDITIEVIT